MLTYGLKLGEFGATIFFETAVKWMEVWGSQDVKKVSYLFFTTHWKRTNIKYPLKIDGWRLG